MQYDTGMTVWRNVPSRAVLETWTHGWHAVIKQEIESGTTKSRAYIELVAGDERIVAPTLFSDLEDAMEWCLTELGYRIPIIRLARYSERPTPLQDLRQAIVNHLRQYDILTVRRLIPVTLSHWDAVRAGELRKKEDYCGGSWLGLEGGWYFWYALHEMAITYRPLFSPGSISFGDDWSRIDRAAHEWAMELVQVPVSFYVAIYTFTLAVRDWLQTCDLGALIEDRKPEQEIIQEFIKDWKLQVGLD